MIHQSGLHKNAQDICTVQNIWVMITMFDAYHHWLFQPSLMLHDVDFTCWLPCWLWGHLFPFGLNMQKKWWTGCQTASRSSSHSELPRRLQGSCTRINLSVPHANNNEGEQIGPCPVKKNPKTTGKSMKITPKTKLQCWQTSPVKSSVYCWFFWGPRPMPLDCPFSWKMRSLTSHETFSSSKTHVLELPIATRPSLSTQKKTKWSPSCSEILTSKTSTEKNHNEALEQNSGRAAFWHCQLVQRSASKWPGNTSSAWWVV